MDTCTVCFYPCHESNKRQKIKKWKCYHWCFVSKRFKKHRNCSLFSLYTVFTFLLCMYFCVCTYIYIYINIYMWVCGDSLLLVCFIWDRWKRNRSCLPLRWTRSTEGDWGKSEWVSDRMREDERRRIHWLLFYWLKHCHVTLQKDPLVIT